jgi:extradiol dioxygenase family protein
MEFKGHQWVKELFLISQHHTNKVSGPRIMMLSMGLSVQWPIVRYIFKLLAERKDHEAGIQLEAQPELTLKENLLYYIP